MSEITASPTLMLDYSMKEVCADELHPGPPYRTGGPFCLTRCENGLDKVVCNGSYTSDPAQLIVDKYDGGFIHTYRPDVSAYMLNEYRFADLGPTAWNMFKPGKPTADLAVFIAELRDLPRMLSTTANFFHKGWSKRGGGFNKRNAKNAANHWLNFQFGWLPFLSDLRKFCNTYDKMERTLAFMKRNNGKWIRRGGTVTSGSSMEVLEQSTAQGLYPGFVSSMYENPLQSGTNYRTRKIKDRVWFEAVMKYYIPDIQTPEWSRSARRKLFGASVTPAVVWELVPWSWLVDWFSNVGDNIANLDNGLAENLVAKYAFLMGTREVTLTEYSTINYKYGPIEDEASLTVIMKERTHASPFGFGLTSTDLNARQLSILTALGLTRFL